MTGLNWQLGRRTPGPESRPQEIWRKTNQKESPIANGSRFQVLATDKLFPEAHEGVTQAAKGFVVKSLQPRVLIFFGRKNFCKVVVVGSGRIMEVDVDQLKRWDLFQNNDSNENPSGLLDNINIGIS